MSDGGRRLIFGSSQRKLFLDRLGIRVDRVLVDRSLLRLGFLQMQQWCRESSSRSRHGSQAVGKPGGGFRLRGHGLLLLGDRIRRILRPFGNGERVQRGWRLR